jgi:hypothetical protein
MRSMALSTDVPGFSQSRRIHGMINTTREKNMYSSVFFFIEKGLANEEELIKRVVKMIYQVQAYESYDKFPFFCIAFGSGEINDQLPQPFFISDYKLLIVKELIRLSGSDTPEPSMLNDIKFKRKDPFQEGIFIPVRPKKDDLLVFFCRNKSNIQISDDIQRQLAVLRRTVFWIETETIQK